MKVVKLEDIMYHIIGVNEQGRTNAIIKITRVPMHRNHMNYVPGPKEYVDIYDGFIKLYGFRNNEKEMALGIEWADNKNEEVAKVGGFINKFNKGFAKNHYLSIQIWDAENQVCYMRTRFQEVHFVENIVAAKWLTQFQEVYILEEN